MEHKIGLVGYGYWGKILYKNLLKLGYKNVVICDIDGKGHITDYSTLDVSHVFIATPPSTHYKICKHFLKKGINVFCEKPLVTNIKEANDLYKISDDKGIKLFTDWTFIYNYAVQRLKKEYDQGLLGDIQSITMHRYNDNITHIVDGTTCKWDLACHDVSIVQYLVEKIPNKTSFIDYSKKNGKKDSTFGLLSYDNFSATINVSWNYGKKLRECVFNFSGATIIWDDKIQKLTYLPKSESHIWEEVVDYSSEPSPLINSITNFLIDYEDTTNKTITLQTIKILN